MSKPSLFCIVLRDAAPLPSYCKQLKSHVITCIFSDKLLLVITTCKRSLGQGNVFTHVCHSVQGGLGPCPGGSLGSLSGGSVQWGLCREGSVQWGVCPVGYLSSGDLCLGSLCPGTPLPTLPTGMHSYLLLCTFVYAYNNACRNVA